MSFKSLGAILDHTRLKPDDSAEQLALWLQHMQQSPVLPYGLCVLPQWLSWIKAKLHDVPVRLVTVANFPSGRMKLADILQVVEQSLEVGFDEIDVVIPYQDILAGHDRSTGQLIQAVKALVGARPVKAIIELAVLTDSRLVQRASMQVIEAGADFIKTSTGTIAYTITQTDIHALLSCIQQAGGVVGLKLAGEISTIEQAQLYQQWVTYKMGASFIQPSTFRIGSSQLLTGIHERCELVNKNLSLCAKDSEKIK